MNRLKLGALLAAIALTLFSVGCGGDSSNTSNANATNSNAAKSNMNGMNMNK